MKLNRTGRQRSMTGCRRTGLSTIWGIGVGHCWNRSFPISPRRPQDGDAGAGVAGDGLSIINGEFFQHTGMPQHIYPLKNNFKNLRKFIITH
jgi:hypothetical protein